MNLRTTIGLLGTCVLFGGCSRMIGEGAGVVMGASGKVVAQRNPTSLAKYNGLKVDTIGVAGGIYAPSGLSGQVRSAFEKAAREDLHLTSSGTPALTVSGEIVHYEVGGKTDELMGPFQELVVHTRLTDAESGQLLGEANLVGRAKSSSSSGAENLAEGAAKALEKWLKEYDGKRKD